MTNWPSIAQPSYNSSEEYYRPQIKTEFEANYAQSRPTATRSIYRWSLKWSAMPLADYATLKTFFNTNQGLSFTWTNAIDSSSHTVRFSDSSLKAQYITKDYVGVEVNIEEV